LLDGAPILSVALAGSLSPPMLLHWMPAAIQREGVAIVAATDERSLLVQVAEVLSQIHEETVICGHNVLRFDLPKLRRRMLVHGLLLPPCLVCRDWPVFDTMHEWSRYTLDDRPYVALSECLNSCGILNPKQVIDGSMTQTMYEQRRWEELAAYALADVLATRELVWRMTGQAAGHALATSQLPTPALAAPPSPDIQSLIARYSEMHR
ncbi:MAG: ribonuclease H-like domain-containing protein, partial [Anaerolineae bacterium]|nr:ribonuclease H-like domain-containing protein [Anaerolineae bacterium]